jgi:hypothetical protein
MQLLLSKSNVFNVQPSVSSFHRVVSQIKRAEGHDMQTPQTPSYALSLCTERKERINMIIKQQVSVDIIQS